MNNTEFCKVYKKCRELTAQGLPCWLEYSGHVDCMSISFARYRYRYWLKVEYLAISEIMKTVDFERVMSRLKNIEVIPSVLSWVGNHTPEDGDLDRFKIMSDGHIYDKREGSLI